MGRRVGARRSGAERPADGFAIVERARPGDGDLDHTTPNGHIAEPVLHRAALVKTSPAIAHDDRPVGLTERVIITLPGFRHPVVAILLAISFMTVISGKPVDGLLIVSVATALAWDAGMRAREAKAAAVAASGSGLAGSAAETDQHDQASAWRLRATRPRLRHVAIGTSAAVIYSLIVGSFTRYSWPATAGVVGLGAGVVIVGWGGPTRQRVIPAKFGRTGLIAWGSLLVAGGVWELSALLGQPSLEQSSYAHPTISTLTDPVLASSFGRTIALLGWIGLGVFLVER
jgi:hypothetical protein